MRKSLIGGTVAVTVFGVVAALLFAGCEISDADAQVSVQPVYVRPSKGKAITVFSAVTGTTTSEIYDFTGFNGVQLSAACNTCPAGLLEVQGSLTPTGTFQTSTNQDPNATYTMDVSTLQTFTVSDVAPYIRIKYTAAGVNPLTLTIIPVPFGSVLGGSGRQGSTSSSLVGLRLDALGRTSLGAATNATAATATTVTGGADLVHASSAFECSVTCMNTDTAVAFCSQTSAVSTSTGFPLIAAGGAGGAGGVQTWDRYGGDIYCISAGTTVIRCQATACP